EVAAVGDLYRAAGRLQGRLAFQRKGERIFRGAFGAQHGRLVRGERSRQIALENVEILQRSFRKRLGCDRKILRQDIRRRMSNKIRHQEGVELRCVAVVEGEVELGAVGTQALQRM